LLPAIVVVAVGGFFLLSAPISAQVAGFTGCAVLAGIGLTAIGFGFPGAWDRLEHLCTETFPKFNPLRRIREPFRARLKKNAAPRKSFIGRMKPRLSEHHKDVFLCGVTLEGAAVGAVGWSALVIVPTVTALPAITIGGGILLAWSTWCVGTCVFDIYNSAKTLHDAYRTHRSNKKEAKAKAKAVTPPAPPAQEAKAKPLPAATAAFNGNAAAPANDNATAAESVPTTAPAKRANGPKPL
ncbi:MAG: hypothetical protein KGL10_03620, partial [Alphaproteobacteria bacterium]|nr:hypothetical protein [Alphaproteobacteria bacterium]